ncbi:MAG TPA: response regulator [Terriglobales bacterium]|jgi:CheY-like chemotaxis protein|nr:response regulator [Terriglobales bacterium]
MRILLIEDDDATREILSAVLKRTDFSLEIETAADGDDGFACYSGRGPFDLLITDHAHPGLRGIEFIDLVLSRNPLQPIVFQTGNSGPHIEDFKQRHPSITVLQKPYCMELFQDIVRSAQNVRM